MYLRCRCIKTNDQNDEPRTLTVGSCESLECKYPVASTRINAIFFIFYCPDTSVLSYSCNARIFMPSQGTSSLKRRVACFRCADHSRSLPAADLEIKTSEDACLYLNYSMRSQSRITEFAVMLQCRRTALRTVAAPRVVRCEAEHTTGVSRNANLAKLQAGYLFPEVIINTES